MLYAKDIFAIAASGYLAVMAVPRVFFPELTLATWGPGARDHPLTQTEEILERSLAVAELAISALIIINCGTLPITSAREHPATRHPTLLCASLYFSACSFFSYEITFNPPLGGSGHQFLFAAVAHGILGALGLWCVLFGRDAAEIRSETSRESTKEHASNFPFKNIEADKIKAKKEE